MSGLNPPLLEVQSLKTQFLSAGGVVPAVNGVNFTLARGETLGLVGESGCGKTVTALSILRLIPESTGHLTGNIFFEGQDLLNLTPAQMRRVRGNSISMIFQEPMTALNPVLTIGDQIMEVLQLHRGLNHNAALTEAAQCLTRVGLSDPQARLKQYPHQLSGGLRQRAMIAMSLACDPQLVIADEPTTALDVTIQAQILALMTRLKAELQMAMLLITHNLGVVAQIAERVAVMYGGLIVETAPTPALFAQPRHPYTAGLLASVPRLNFSAPAEEELHAIAGHVPSPRELPPGCFFQPRCSKAFAACDQPPPWVEVGDRHGVLCWLYESGSNQ
jgi:oligopeptide/dipeptide ABC transporter ATP-binding protein